VDILSAIKERLNQKFGPGGDEEEIFRAVWRRPWKPGNTVRPALTVVDDGQMKTDGNPEDSKDVVLKIKLMLDLAANWDREAAQDTWSPRIQAIVESLINWLPTGAIGVTRLDYLSDDPLDVLIPDGKSESIWVIEFECTYFLDVETRDRD